MGIQVIRFQKYKPYLGQVETKKIYHENTKVRKHKKKQFQILKPNVESNPNDKLPKFLTLNFRRIAYICALVFFVLFLFRAFVVSCFRDYFLNFVLPPSNRYNFLTLCQVLLTKIAKMESSNGIETDFKFDRVIAKFLDLCGYLKNPPKSPFNKGGLLAKSGFPPLKKGG